MPSPPTNQVNEATVMAAMPMANLRPWTWMSDRAPLQVTHLNSRMVSHVLKDLQKEGDDLPFSGVYFSGMYIPKLYPICEPRWPALGTSSRDLLAS